MLTGLKHTEDRTLPILVSDLKRFPLPLDRIDLTHFFYFWYWPSCLDFKNNLSHKEKQEDCLTILRRHYLRTNHWLCSPRETVLINMESSVCQDLNSVLSLFWGLGQLTWPGQPASLPLPSCLCQRTATKSPQDNSTQPPHRMRPEGELGGWTSKRVCE